MDHTNKVDPETDRMIVQRASDDRRLTDIQESVHEIRSDVRGLERRFERNEERINDVEREVIEQAANQRALEAVMSSETHRLTDKIDQVNTSVKDVSGNLRVHIEQQTRDFKSAFRILVSILITMLGTGGVIIIQHIFGKIVP